jgi:hypothetical protein
LVSQIKVNSMRGRIEVQLKISELATKLESGADVSAIMLEYMPKWGISERTINRYIALAKDIVSGRLKKREALLEAMRGEVLTREAEEGLKSTLELEAKRYCGWLGRDGKGNNHKGWYRKNYQT